MLSRPSNWRVGVLVGVLLLAISGCTDTSATTSSSRTLATPTTPANQQTSLYVGVSNFSTGADQSTIEALDPTTGAVRWQSTAYAGYTLFLQVAYGVVYALISNGANGVLVALQGSNGQQLWEVTPRAAGAAAMDPAAGAIYLSSPSYTGQDGLVEAYQASDGTLLWQHDAGSCAAGQLAAGSDIVFVIPTGCSQPKVAALRESDGSVLWQQIAPNDTPGGGLAIQAGVAYLNVYGAVCAYTAAHGTQLWCYQAPSSVGEGDSFADVAGKVYAANGTQVLAMQASSGHLSWSESLGGLINGVACTPTAVYVATGNLVALSASSGRHLWTARLDLPGPGQPLVANGVIYINDDTDAPSVSPEPAYLYAVNARDGAVLWKYTVSAGAISAPALG